MFFHYTLVVSSLFRLLVVRDIGCKSYCKNSAVIPNSLLLHRFWNMQSCASSIFLKRVICWVFKFLIHTLFVYSLSFLCSHNFWLFFSYCNNKNITKTRQDVIHSHHLQLFHNGGIYHIETSPLIYSANQWTSFYMLLTSVMKVK